MSAALVLSCCLCCSCGSLLIFLAIVCRYPVPADLVKAKCQLPPAPTLGGGDAAEEHKLRTYNIDNASAIGDWTRWNPWRSPGTAGKGNTAFQPCGVNSGARCCR